MCVCAGVGSGGGGDGLGGPGVRPDVGREEGGGEGVAARQATGSSTGRERKDI